MGKTYWMLSTTRENFEITRDLGFTVQGVESRQRRKAVRMAPDDRLMFYIPDRRAFAGSATITSKHFEDHDPIWRHHREDEDFPHRVEIRADVVLPEEKWLEAMQIGPRMEYVRKWPPEMWHLAFLGALHILPQRDFSMLEDELRRADSGDRRGRRRRQRRGRGRSRQRRASTEAAAAE